MAESVSAANEVKLTEAEKSAITGAVVDTIHGEYRHFEMGKRVEETVVAILGARLSAREPDNALVLPDPRGGCVCEPYSQSPGGVYTEHLVEYEPACPVHSEHVYNPRTGVWDLAVPVSGVPTEAVRELAEMWAEVHREEDDALDDLGLYHVAYRECAADLAALVQRAAETNESET